MSVDLTPTSLEDTVRVSRVGLDRLREIEKAASDFEREFGGIPAEDLMSVVGVTNSNVLLRKWQSLRNALQPPQTEKEVIAEDISPQ